MVWPTTATLPRTILCVFGCPDERRGFDDRLSTVVLANLHHGVFSLVQYRYANISAVGVLAAGTVWGGVYDLFGTDFDGGVVYVFLCSADLF